MSLHTPFYNPELSYEENFERGPFGAFADGEVLPKPGKPQQHFLSFPVHQPFGIAAGPLINGAYVKAAFQKGFDICVYKTVRSRPHPCHPAPNVLAVHLEQDLTPERAAQPLVADAQYREPLSITNSFGVPSMDPDWWQPDMEAAVQAAGEGQVMAASFQGTKPASGRVEDFIADYVTTARLVQETGAPILIANLSCPNEGTADLLCFDVERVGKIAEQVKSAIGETPLLLKLAYFPDDAHILRLLERVGDVVQGLVAINTIPAAIVNEQGNQALPGEGRRVSGVCGASIRWAGLEMTHRLVALREKLGQEFAIIGTGGVTTAQDYAAYRTAGADAVFCATGAMWNPYLAQEVAELD